MSTELSAPAPEFDFLAHLNLRVDPIRDGLDDLICGHLPCWFFRKLVPGPNLGQIIHKRVKKMKKTQAIDKIPQISPVYNDDNKGSSWVPG